MDQRLKQGIKRNQAGMVSIIVTVIIMLVLSLIVIGFARLTRREQRQALDRQLSTQAFYASESGVNDAKQAIKSNPALLSAEYTVGCGDFISAAGLNTFPKSTTIAGSGAASYTCLFVDPSPPSLEYANIGVDSSTVIPIQNKNAGAAVGVVNIFWEDKNGGTDFSGCAGPAGGLPQSWPASCNPGILRIDLVEFPVAGASRNSLVANTMTTFIYPSGGGPTDANYANKGFGPSGTFAVGSCNSGGTPKKCQAKITNLPGNRYYMRLTAVYKPSAVTITADNGAGTPVELTGAQAIIDSTGKANDILRRIQVRLPLGGIIGTVPMAAIDAVGNICKRFSIFPPNGYISDPAGECSNNPPDTSQPF